MITILISITILMLLFMSIFIILLFLKKELNDIWFKWVFILGFSFGLLLYGYLAYTTESTEDTYTSDTKVLYSIERDSSVGGSFFLGSGSFSNEQVYIFYIKNANGSLTLDKVSAYNTEVFEGDYTPKLIKTTCHYGTEFSYLLGGRFIKDNACENFKVKYSLYLPKNTIIKKMKL